MRESVGATRAMTLRSSTSAALSPTRFPGCASSPPLPAERKLDHRLRPAAFARLEEQRTAVLVDDLLRDGQPESGSLRLRRPKRSQELRAVEPRRYARAPVPHQDARLLAVGARGDFHRAV